MGIFSICFEHLSYTIGFGRLWKVSKRVHGADVSVGSWKSGKQGQIPETLKRESLLWAGQRDEARH
jgi:hypothetical protein